MILWLFFQESVFYLRTVQAPSNIPKVAPEKIIPKTMAKESSVVSSTKVMTSLLVTPRALRARAIAELRARRASKVVERSVSPSI